MRCLVATQPGVLEWEETPAPRLDAEADAIVRPIAVTVCDLDRRHGVRPRPHYGYRPVPVPATDPDGA